MKVALLSDVHGALTALEAVLAALPPVDELWVMGDTVGYGPDPSDVLALLRERGAILVAGNHDRAVATGEGLEYFNGAAGAAARLHAAWLSAEERAYLGELPEIVSREGVALCHGSFRDPLWEYVLSEAAAAASLDRAPAAHGCCGHTHVPALFQGAGPGLALVRPRPGEPYPLAARALVNPGSVGQPRDGDPRAAYAVLDLAAREVVFGRVPYDIPATQGRIRARGLPESLADRLAVGR